MARITIIDLTITLEETRTILLAAADDDGMVSRADLKQLLQQTEDDLKRRFLEMFYGFLIKLENRPRMRVTREVIDKGITFINEQIIPNFELHLHFSLSTEQKIAQVHESALPIAMQLIRRTTHRVTLSPREVYQRITPLTDGLFFDDYGSEAAMAITPFFLEHPDQPLSAASFVQALGIDPQSPKGKVERFEPAEQGLRTFVEQHVRSGLSERARTLAELMQTHLNDLTIFILGEDNHPDLNSNHPVYVVGSGQYGHLAGFESVVIWT